MSSITTDILIIGAGPGGLACARLLAEQGRKVLLVERHQEIGPKVCAGGVTWNGLLRLIPEELIERDFREQHIFTPCQQTVLREKHPVIATVSRKALGQEMARQARQAGAEIITGMNIRHIQGLRVTGNRGGTNVTIRCSQLVGADGANSLVRRTLGIPAQCRGLGINFQVPGTYEQMEWHMALRAFGSGYAWIFPHKQSISIGACCLLGTIPADILKGNLLRWAGRLGFQLQGNPCQAAVLNYDYRGYAFGPVWLIGDAAGLASVLTGEGIYPAIISGQAVARRILDPDSSDKELIDLVRRQRQHHRIAALFARHSACSFLLMELLVLLFRSRLLNFHIMELAPVR